MRIDAQFGQNLLHIGALRVGVLMGDVAHMQDHVGLQNLFQRGAEGRDQHGAAGRK